MKQTWYRRVYWPLALLLILSTGRLHGQAAAYLDASAQNFGTLNICPPGSTTPKPCSATLTADFEVTASGTLGTPKVLTRGAPNLDFTLVSTTCSGTIQAIAICTVTAAFSPKSPGLREGAIELVSAAGNTLATAYLHGIGIGPQVDFDGAPPAVLVT